MRSYEGTFRIRLHADKGITVDRGVQGSKLTAADVNDAVQLMIEHATANKCGIDRWAMYIPGVNEKLSKDATQLTVASVKKAVKDPENEVTLQAARWGKPRIVIAPKVTVTKRQSKFVDIA